MKKTIRALALALASVCMMVLLAACGESSSGPKAPEGTVEFNGHHYAFVYAYSEESTWQDAALQCREQNAHLVIIDSKEENEFLTKTLKEKSIQNAYIGFTDIEEAGNWTWVDNSKVAYTNWHSGEPNHADGKDYAVLCSEDGTWKSGSFRAKDDDGLRFFICEWDY